MSSILLFTDTWYNDFINQTVDRLDDKVSPDGHAVAVALISGLCCVAQAIDNLAGDEADRPTITKSLEHIGDRIEAAIEAAAERLA